MLFTSSKNCPFLPKKKKVTLLVILFYTENEIFPLQIPKLYKQTHRALSQVGETSCRDAQGLVGIQPMANPGLVLRALAGILLTAKKWEEKCRKQVLSYGFVSGVFQR